MTTQLKGSLGVTAFTKHIEESNENGWSDFLSHLAKRAKHVQFLPPGTVKFARFLAEVTKDEGLETSVLWVTFHPTCPCADAHAAFEEAKKAIDLGRIIAGNQETNLVCSPSMLRGLNDPDHGLCGADDEMRQVEFIGRVAKYARSVRGTKVAAEPLNRFETRGPNTIMATVSLINDAVATDVVGVLADTCHQGLGEMPILATWNTFAEYILAIHASSRNRTFLGEDPDICEALAMAREHRLLSKVPVINETFCDETNPDFFPVLGMHQPPRCSALEMFDTNLKQMRV